MQSNVNSSDVELKGVPIPADANNVPVPLLVVVGAGPVGCTTALAFAKAGWEVSIYEGRADIRLSSSKKNLAQRSVNLAISSRGLAALYSIEPNLMDRILNKAIPMKGRLLHLASGKTESQLYDPSDQCIHSIDRGLLNQVLLQEAINCPAIQVHFEHKLTTADFNRRILTFSTSNKEALFDVHFDLCVGADGSYSNVRRQMMRVMRMDYQQYYIPHDYVELKIPAGIDESGKRYFLLDPNHLHIWPRYSFMLIALPNEDKSFTSTLFAPTSELAKLDTREKASEWLKEYFPDAVSLVGEETLLNDFERNPRNSLISLQAKPYHYKDRCIILGDAAHSMVPFYGQGLNCGLEDVRVLMNILRNEGVIQPSKRKGGDVDQNLERAFRRYSETRHDDLVAICDLAMDN
ncbi:hypothetical protein Clacol_006299 [Clathrus columnatus]|uniref:FAD-binding domain-containing protein n=1 Tax=Clathrus columnatus TaxID=1419009 RepID=A0AAV5AH87_9AGAM|nr:hypothetical protein Clacol_006299 [Clathrus columnatus]